MLSLSIIVPTLNNAKDMPQFMESLRMQTFPKNKTEILVMDGGSADDTVAIAKKYGATVIPNPKVLAEPGVNLGMSKAKGNLMMILAVDNIYNDSAAIEKIVHVFENPTIFAAFPKHDSEIADTIFSKYHNTFTDPFNHFVYGYACNGRTFDRVYTKIAQNKLYTVFDFSSNATPPLIGFAQGFTVRGSYQRAKSDEFDDIQPIMKLVKEAPPRGQDKGSARRRKKIAFVHSVSVIHHTTRSLGHFIRKTRWATRNSLSKKKYGIAYRKSTLSEHQKLRITLWPLYALSVIMPTIVAIYGILRDRQRIWIFHPILCFISAVASIYEVITYNSGNRSTIIRQ